MSPSKLLREYLLFSRRDRLAILLLLVLIGLLWALPGLVKAPETAASGAETEWLQAANQLVTVETNFRVPTEGPEHKEFRKNHGDAGYNASGAKLFSFDPNTLDEAGWVSLGVRAKTAATIRNYLEKGGRFRGPEDLERIYGMSSALAARLKPFVRITESRPVRSFKEKEKEKPPAARYVSDTRVSFPRISPVDINAADTSALIALPGIGSKLAGRIIRFREKLGGFYSVEQVREVYGLADSVYQRIRPFLELRTAAIRPLLINELAAEELKEHPYLKYELARTIIAYREQHGRFKDLADLENVAVLSPDLLEKIGPYMAF